MDYLKNILIGGIILAIVQNLEKIIDYIKELWNETLKPIFQLVEQMDLPTNMDWIEVGCGEGTPIVKDILKQPTDSGNN